VETKQREKQRKKRRNRRRETGGNEHTIRHTTVREFTEKLSVVFSTSNHKQHKEETKTNEASAQYVSPVKVRDL